MRKSILLPVLLFTVSALNAQTLEEIIQNHLEIKGGYEAIKAVQTIKVVGKTMMRGNESEFTAYFKKPDRTRYEGNFGGTPVISGYDGENFWSTMQRQG